MTLRRRRMLATLLALALCLSLLPMSALAAEADALGETGPEEAVCTCTAPCTEGGMNTACPVCGAEGAAPEDCGQSLPQGSGEAKTQPLANDGISLLSTQEKVSYIDPTKEQTKQTCDSATVVTETDTAWGASDSQEHWYVVNSNVTINTRVTVTGDVHLILKDGFTLNATKGINVSKGNSLTIYAQSAGEGMGKLITTGSVSVAGIGGIWFYGADSANCTSGTITINGGMVKATGGYSSAGIGGSSSGGAGGTITINGGTVTATGGTNAAGIGGDGGNITINGGTVTATGGSGGAGIGGRREGTSGGTITINGGHVTANGSQRSFYSAGIGGGFKGAGGSITINGGVVDAHGGWTGIGSGEDGYSGTATGDCAVAVNGGVVTATGEHDAGIGGTFSTGNNGNAVIIASSISGNDNTTGWSGLIITKTQGEGKIYGSDSFEIVDDLEIPEGYTLTIEKGKTLTIPTDVTLTVDGEIINNGTMTIQGSITGTGSIIPKFEQNVGKPTASASQVTDTTLTIEAVTKPDGAIGNVQYGYTTENEKEIPAERWSSSSTFSGLAPATKHTIYVRYSGNGFYEPVVSTGVEVYTAYSAPGENEGYTINYANETVTAASNYEVRPTESDGWTASGTALSITPGGTFQVRHAAAMDGAPASEPLTVNVEARPAAPILAIDNEAEGVTIPSGYSYNTTSEDYSNTWTQGDGSLVKIEPGNSIYIYQAATDSSFKSAVQTLTAPARASTPTAPTINYEGEALSGNTAGMEYREGNTGEWVKCTADMSLANIGWRGNEMTVYFRTAATDLNYASAPTAGLTIPARRAAPAAPTTTDRTDDSITITALDGVQYRLGGNGEWQTSDTGSLTFDGLISGTEYTIYARYPAVTEGENPAFASGSASTQVTTKSNQTAAPTAPTMVSRTTTSVILNYIESPIRQGAVQYGYTTAGDSSDYHWQESTEFIDLQPGTTYTFYARYAETDDYEASPASTGTSIVTLGAEGGDTLADGETITTEDDTNTEITKDEGKITITPGNGGSATVITPDDNVTVNTGDGTVNVPGGSTVTDSDGERVTIPPEGGTLQPGGEVKYTVTVTFDSQGGSQVPSQDITVGEPVSQPDDPTRTGYRFLGWYTAATGGARWDFSQPVTGDQILYAQWAYLPPANPNYKITIGDTENGTVTVNPTAAKAGTTVTITPVPDAGYQVGTVSVTDRFGQAVAVDQQADGTYTFVMPDGQVTVEVTFLQGEATDLPFSDVTESDWFYDAVTYAYENGLMDGVGTGLFAPNSETTRAQLVTILYRLAGQPAPSGDSGFSDVETGIWYTDAVAWAAQNGIVNGVSDTQFAPGDDITREQLAVILYRYATYQGYDVSQRADLSGFVDAGTISTYAQEALSWANAQGLVLGFEDDSLRPQGNASRAQIAAVLMRFCQTVAE